MKEKLIIIGSGKFQIRLVDTAKKLAYETHVFAWEDEAVCKDIADYFYPISVTDKDAILNIARKINPQGVVSIGSDLAVPTVNYIASKLGLIGNSIQSSNVSTNKYEMRKALKAKGLPCPAFTLVDNNEPLNIPNMHYPLIVKPVDRSGSRGVTLVNHPDSLNSAIKNAREQSFIGRAIVEEYFAGQEYSMEMISYKGEHSFLAITEKFTTEAPNFVEIMHLQPGRIDHCVLKEAIEMIKLSLDALNIEFGASHSEFKVDEDGRIMIIEIGARMGGDYIGSDLVRLSTGYDFTHMVIDIAVGKEPDLTKNCLTEKASLVKFVFSQEDLIILEDLKTKHFDKIYTYGDIREINGEVVADSSQRFGYFILQCDTRKDCLQLMRSYLGDFV